MVDKTLDIEETNRIRVSLGMQPLPVPPKKGNTLNAAPSKRKDPSDDDSEDGDQQGSTLESREALAGDNWKKLKDEQDAEQRRRETKEKLRKQREADQRFSKISGKGLGDLDSDDMDTKSWLLQSQKRQKKIQKKRARALEQELAERENQAQYTERDLAGARVGHDLGDIEEGDQILTLKDTAVDAEDEEDELENADVRDKEKRVERLELKKKKPVYDAQEAAEGGKSSILGQYDEEIGGKKKKQFKLNDAGSARGKAASTGLDMFDESIGPRGTKISLDFVKDDKPISDYQDVAEIKIKKSKKKKEKSKRKRDADDDMFAPDENVSETKADPSAMDVDSNSIKPAPKKRPLEDVSFVDDDDLQSHLAMQRKAALKKRKMARPEDLARELREEGADTPMSNAVDREPAEEGGLVIDETSEFLSNLQKPEPRQRPQPQLHKQENAVKPEVQQPNSPASDADGDVDVDKAHDETGSDVELKSHAKPEPEQDRTATGLDEESTLTEGLGSTLNMLTQRGLLKKAGTGDPNADLRERQRFLQEKQRREAEADRRARAQRERDRQSGKLERMSAREREAYAQRENQMRDQQDSRQMAEVFNRDYKPSVDLKYVDEYGRHMDQKEAFRFLSHQFHGKGSGKQKTEKKLKNIDEEKKKEAQSSLDTSVSTGMDKAARNYRQAGVRLQ